MLQGHILVMVRWWQSIYDVYQNLKDLVAAGKVELIETSSIASAIKIYSSGRASLLWGSNMFEWYFMMLRQGSSIGEYQAQSIVRIKKVIWQNDFY
jgi:hypothetical protein